MASFRDVLRGALEGAAAVNPFFGMVSAVANRRPGLDIPVERVDPFVAEVAAITSRVGLEFDSLAKATAVMQNSTWLVSRNLTPLSGSANNTQKIGVLHQNISLIDQKIRAVDSSLRASRLVLDYNKKMVEKTNNLVQNAIRDSSFNRFASIEKDMEARLAAALDKRLAAALAAAGGSSTVPGGGGGGFGAGFNPLLIGAGAAAVGAGAARIAGATARAASTFMRSAAGGALRLGAAAGTGLGSAARMAAPAAPWIAGGLAAWEILNPRPVGNPAEDDWAYRARTDPNFRRQVEDEAFRLMPLGPSRARYNEMIARRRARSAYKYEPTPEDIRAFLGIDSGITVPGVVGSPQMPFNFSLYESAKKPPTGVNSPYGFYGGPFTPNSWKVPTGTSSPYSFYGGPFSMPSPSRVNDPYFGYGGPFVMPTPSRVNAPHSFYGGPFVLPTPSRVNAPHSFYGGPFSTPTPSRVNAPHSFYGGPFGGLTPSRVNDPYSFYAGSFKAPIPYSVTSPYSFYGGSFNLPSPLAVDSPYSFFGGPFVPPIPSRVNAPHSFYGGPFGGLIPSRVNTPHSFYGGPFSMPTPSRVNDPYFGYGGPFVMPTPSRVNAPHSFYGGPFGGLTPSRVNAPHSFYGGPFVLPTPSRVNAPYTGYGGPFVMPTPSRVNDPHSFYGGPFGGLIPSRVDAPYTGYGGPFVMPTPSRVNAPHSFYGGPFGGLIPSRVNTPHSFYGGPFVPSAWTAPPDWSSFDFMADPSTSSGDPSFSFGLGLASWYLRDVPPPMAPASASGSPFYDRGALGRRVRSSARIKEMLREIARSRGETVISAGAADAMHGPRRREWAARRRASRYTDSIEELKARLEALKNKRGSILDLPSGTHVADVAMLGDDLSGIFGGIPHTYGHDLNVRQNEMAVARSEHPDFDQQFNFYRLRASDYNLRAARVAFEVDETFDLQSSTTISIKALEKITLQAPTIELVGNVEYRELVEGGGGSSYDGGAYSPSGGSSSLPAPSSPTQHRYGGGGSPGSGPRVAPPAASGGGGSSPSAPNLGSPAPSDRANAAMAYFVSKGWTKEQAAGLVGNLMAESGANLDINARGDGGRAYGIAQWHPDRQANFREAFGKDIRSATFEEQLAFVDWELNNTEKSAGNRLRAAGSVEEATAAAIGYERPSGYHISNPQGGHNYRGREAYARGLFESGGGYQIPASAASHDGHAHANLSGSAVQPTSRNILDARQVPMDGGRPNSRGFGGNRGTGLLHTGVDIPVEVGEPIKAIADGKIVRADNSNAGGYGYVVDVEYADGTVHRFAHLGTDGGGRGSAIPEGLKVGSVVKAGDVIGFGGYSGNAGASFPHVHHEVIKSEVYHASGGRPAGRARTVEELQRSRVNPTDYYANLEAQREQSIQDAKANDPNAYTGPDLIANLKAQEEMDAAKTQAAVSSAPPSPGPRIPDPAPTPNTHDGKHLTAKNLALYASTALM